MNSHDPHQDAELYVAGALEPDDRAVFEAHLAECSECVSRVSELEAVAASLSQVVALAPPESLRASVLEAIAATPQLGMAAERPERPVPSLGGIQPRLTRQRHASAPLQRWRRPAGLVAAAAVLIALGCLGWAITSQHKANVADSRQHQLVQLLAARDVKTATGTLAPGGQATLVVSRGLGKAVLVVSDLPAPPDGKVYELWRIDTAPHPAGTFTPDTAGQMVIALPAAVTGARQVAMTVEPAGGSSQPTSKPVLAVLVPGG